MHNQACFASCPPKTYTVGDSKVCMALPEGCNVMGKDGCEKCESATMTRQDDSTCIQLPPHCAEGWREGAEIKCTKCNAGWKEIVVAPFGCKKDGEEPTEPVCPDATNPDCKNP